MADKACMGREGREIAGEVGVFGRPGEEAGAEVKGEKTGGGEERVAVAGERDARGEKVKGRRRLAKEVGHRRRERGGGRYEFRWYVPSDGAR